MQTFVSNNKPDEQEPECQAQKREEVAREAEVTQGDT